MYFTTKHKLDEQTLLSRIAQRNSGWRDLLAFLLQQHHEALLRRCFSYLKNRADADDAVQETELRAFRAIHSFRGESAFRTWLFTIADRQCHTLAARRQRHMITEHLQALIEIHEYDSQSGNVSMDAHDEVNLALMQLPENNRDVLTLRFYKDMSLEDMAFTLNISLSATKMRLYRALDQLASQLDGKSAISQYAM